MIANRNETVPVVLEPQVQLEVPPYVGPTRVLVIEDEPSICRALNIALTRAGFDVMTAQTGEMGLALLNRRVYDIALLDFRLPDIKGDVLAHLVASLQPHLRY